MNEPMQPPAGGSVEAIEHCIGVSRHATEFKRLADEAVAELAALRTRLEEAEKRERWIPLATEPAPEMHVRVLITGEEGGVDAIAYLDADGETWRDDYGHRHWPMAWRELPEPYTPSKERDHE